MFFYFKVVSYNKIIVHWKTRSLEEIGIKMFHAHLLFAGSFQNRISFKSFHVYYLNIKLTLSSAYVSNNVVCAFYKK